MMKEPFRAVFNDDYLIVVDKIAKVLIQASPKKEKTTLTSILEKERGERVFPCHRLDRETSGLIIYAKSLKIQNIITGEFKRREIKKKYIAFIKGNLQKKKGVWEGEIIDREGKIFGERKKPAKTIYRVLEDFIGWSMVELLPLTGRTNQLRIQLSEIGHPILGESKYAFRRDFKVKFRRLGLHAFYLNFTHPVSKKRVILNVDLALDMREFLKKDGII